MKYFLIAALVLGLGVLGYGALNYWVFLNVIEDPLSEEQEAIPEPGIIFD